MAADEGIVLEGMRGLTAVLNRLPQGTAARELATRLGLWTAASHEGVEGRHKAFPTNFSRLEDPKLSDENAYWLSEVFRATELCGLLEGQKVILNLQAKSVRAGVRANRRRHHEQEAAKIERAAAEASAQAAQAAAEAGGAPAGARGRAAAVGKVKAPTVTQLNDEVEEDRDVRDVDEALGLLGVVQASANAYKEACLAATAGLSREISFRQAQMGARLR